MSDILNFKLPSGDSQLNFGVTEGVNLATYQTEIPFDISTYSKIHIEALRLYSEVGNNIKYLKIIITDVEGTKVLNKTYSESFTTASSKKVSLYLNLYKVVQAECRVFIQVVVDLGETLLEPSLENIKDLKVYLGK